MTVTLKYIPLTLEVANNISEMYNVAASLD